MESFENKYERAKKRVDELKALFRHIKVFALINGFFYLFKLGVFNRFIPEFLTSEPSFYSWVDINLLIWGVILIVHAVYVYRDKVPLLKKWEARQIQKILDKEKLDNKE
ncbi:hypothetical protein GCM10011414_17180 [Croceivirga lutea]|uniref:2TM domain-containing protein n=1 Tax=Croceivirga lutea TaxID=1775167 RepID=UPI001639A3BC|nr:2TM domain-containing protein [Croceivirga lutea]GGG47990.1 hypothetical protein GCM10011414_17180 [Croceivirga lutea]